MMDDLNDLYQQVILDHSRSPRNFRALPDANRTARGHNRCGRQRTFYLRRGDDPQITFASMRDLRPPGPDPDRRSAAGPRGSRGPVRARPYAYDGQAGGDDLGKSIFGVAQVPGSRKCAILSRHAVWRLSKGRATRCPPRRGALNLLWLRLIALL